jgi:adenylate kinase family enzyme
MNDLPARRIVITASASGNGKTTLGRALAARLGVPFVEVDALVHGPGWSETADEDLRRALEPVLAGPGWVIDNPYQRKLGSLVLEAADLVVWLDLPVRVWLPRLVRRTAERALSREPLWNGNRESLRGVLWGRESLIIYALGAHRRRRREWPERFRCYPVVRLRSTAEVEQWLAGSLTRTARDGC